MFLLKKVIQIRENSHPDHEKPFLEHLEDLRTMIYRIVITLVISMILCFSFNKRLMDFFRHPVDEVLIVQTQASLPTDAPRPLSVESWTQARKVEHAVMNLTPDQRALFYRSLGDESLAFHAQSISLYRAAQAVPETMREGFLTALDISNELKLQVKSLLKSKPNCDSDSQGNLKMMSALKPTEGFMLSMKLSFVAGIVVAFPLLLMYILQFVLPGLHSNEKRVLWPAMAVGFSLFLFGTLFAYYMVLPSTLRFFYQWSGDLGISNDWRIGEYISFATQFTLLFGVAFELPVVVMVFVKLGLLGYETMSRTRGYAIVAIFITAAILTPTPDIATLCVMAVPMILLYEICIWMAWFDRRKNRQLEPLVTHDPYTEPWTPSEPQNADVDLGVDPWDNSTNEQESHPDDSGDDGWSHDSHVPGPHDTHAWTDMPDTCLLDETPPATLPLDEVPPPGITPPPAPEEAPPEEAIPEEAPPHATLPQPSAPDEPSAPDAPETAADPDATGHRDPKPGSPS